jgi:hypothetical protein
MKIDPHALRNASRRIERAVEIDVLVPQSQSPIGLRIEISSNFVDPSIFHGRLLADGSRSDLFEGADLSPIEEIRADSLDLAEMTVWHWLSAWLEKVDGKVGGQIANGSTGGAP